MAETATETATGPSESEAASGVEKGSEFSKPTGAKDDEIWAKHFGKEAKEPKPKTTADGQKRGEGSKSDGKGDSPKSPKQPADATKRSSERTSDKDPSTPKDTKSDKGKDSSSATRDGGKTADKADDAKDTPADPEAPLKRARDLYKEAKGTEDRRKARSLYKRAMTEAFGELPPEFDDKRYAAVRTERAAAQAKLDDQAKRNEARISEAADKLKAPIYVLRQLEGAKLADRITVPMVERAVSVMQALVRLDEGDYTGLAEVISRATGTDHDTAMQRFVKGVKMSPEGKAARSAAAEAARRADEAERRVQALEAKLNERESQQTEAQKRQERERQVAEHRERYLDEIQSDLDGHPVLLLPRGAERVMAYQIRHADKSTRAARYSHQQVADRIVAGEKRRLQESRHLLGEGDAPASREERRGPRGVPRNETVDAGTRSPDPMARFDEIFEKHTASGGRRR